MKQYSSLKQWPAEKIPFDLSGNIMNRICISGALTRGYELCHGDGVDYTFLSRITDNRFKSVTFLSDDMSIYIYLMFETLLGENGKYFMEQWLVDNEEIATIEKAKDLIDTNNGSGSFNKIYKNIQIIIFNNLYCSYMDSEKIVDGFKKIASIQQEMADKSPQDSFFSSISRVNANVCERMLMDNKMALDEAIDELKSLVSIDMPMEIGSRGSK